MFSGAEAQGTVGAQRWPGYFWMGTQKLLERGTLESFNRQGMVGLGHQGGLGRVQGAVGCRVRGLPE